MAEPKTPKADTGAPIEQVMLDCLKLLLSLKSDDEDTDLDFLTADEKRARVVRALAAFVGVPFTTKAILEDLVRAVERNRDGIGTDLKAALDR